MITSEVRIKLTEVLHVPKVCQPVTTSIAQSMFPLKACIKKFPFDNISGLKKFSVMCNWFPITNVLIS